MTGIVLSGGENRRMGADKAFLKVAGVPMIERVLQSLRKVFQNIIIVTNAPHLYTQYDAVLVTDALEQRGPLTGIYSGLSQAATKYGFVVACDMPFLNPNLISYMAGLAGGEDIVVPLFEGRPEPLHAVYSRNLLPVMEMQIKQEKRKIQDIFTGRSVRYVTDREIGRFDPSRRSFVNLNTPGEYEEASCADWACRS